MKLLEIIDLNYILIYLGMINVLEFILFFIDKKFAEYNRWRIAEKTLVIISLLGGSIGGILGMYLFHHKTRKSAFNIGLPLIFIIEVALIIYLWYNGYIV